MEPVLLAVLVIIIAVAAVLRFKFDMDHTLPAIAENKGLSALNIVAYVVVAVMFISFFLQQYVIFVISLVVGIPLLLYANWAIYSAALKRFFKK